jgi:hypothetical protein
VSEPVAGAVIADRLRRFLLVVAAASCLGIGTELWLAEHTGESMQLVPFALCGLGFVASVAALLRPNRQTLLVLRLVMIPVALGSLLGVWEHLEGNLEFVRELQPSASAGAALLEAIYGAAPLLAPIALALIAVLALAATYYNPALEDRES